MKGKIAVILLLLLFIAGEALATPTRTVTPTRTPTVTRTPATPPTATQTPTATPTIPVAVNTWFTTTLKDIMTDDITYYDNCGNIKLIVNGTLPREYWELYYQRNIVYNYLRVVKGYTNAQLQNALDNREAVMKLYRHLKKQGVL